MTLVSFTGRKKHTFSRLEFAQPVLLRLLVCTLLIIGAVCGAPSQQAQAQESSAVAIKLTEDAITAAILSEGTLWLKLTPSGSNQLATATKDNLGNRVTIHVLDHQALSLMVVHELPLDKLVIKAPSPELKAAIEPYLVKSR